jgi:hypothetical protein
MFMKTLLDLASGVLLMKKTLWSRSNHQRSVLLGWQMRGLSSYTQSEWLIPYWCWFDLRVLLSSALSIPLSFFLRGIRAVEFVLWN